MDHATQGPGSAGAREASPDALLPVPAADRLSLQERWRKIGDTEIDDATAEDWIRQRRRDPSHDWMAWSAPVHLDADAASDAWGRANGACRTTCGHCVLRPCHSAAGWLAWAGLGSHMEAVLREDGSALWATRDEARHAALGAARLHLDAATATVRGALEGWPEAEVARVLDGREGRRLYLISGTPPMPAAVEVREGPAAGHPFRGPVSWDLPAPRPACPPEIRPVTPCSGSYERYGPPATRRQAWRQRKWERRARNRQARAMA